MTPSPYIQILNVNSQVKIKNELGSLPDFNKDSLDTIISVPMRQDWQLRPIDLAIQRIDKGQVNPRDELDSGRLIGVRVSTGYLETVNAIFVHCLFVAY
jgi:hypothetical protein